MKIAIKNDNPEIINVAVDKADREIIIQVSSIKRKLGDIPCGDTVKLGECEFIVLEHGTNATAVLTKKPVKRMRFKGYGDWRDSDIRKFCNGEFFDGLANAIGAENIIKHTVKLMADDGTGKELFCEDKVSILTTDLYRRYREYIPAIGNSWLTATRVTHDKETGYTRSVCCVHSSGVLVWGGCDYDSGVRPFCILNSLISV